MENVTVDVNPEPANSSTKTFTVNLTNPISAQILAVSETSGTILNAETCPRSRSATSLSVA